MGVERALGVKLKRVKKIAQKMSKRRTKKTVMPSCISKKNAFQKYFEYFIKIFKKQRFVVLRVSYVYARNQVVFILDFKKKILKMESVCFILSDNYQRVAQGKEAVFRVGFVFSHTAAVGRSTLCASAF
ncbi:hypothetical protein [Bartonella sp. AD13SXNS]|uniref:hypothetical protein n=1 Tax=Bartonella sp. AD13SXNS TaxID=3243462 RepID=UPI0035CF8E0F